MKLQKKHIVEEWSEGEDGYWIALATGWKWNGDPLGAVHQIHECNKQKSHAEGVLPCDCKDCKKTI